MLKRLVKKSEQLDIYNRDSAIAYINGQVFLGETHAECVGMYLDTTDSTKDLDSYRNRPNAEQLQQVDVERTAFAHVLEREKPIDRDESIILPAGIYIESVTLMNVTIDEVKDAIKQAYPQYDVYVFNGDILSKEDAQKIA